MAKRIDWLTAPDGTRYPVKLNEHTGVFTIEIPGVETFEGESLGKVKKEAEQWLDQNKGLDWQPVIQVTIGGSNMDPEFSVEREFRAKNADKKDMYMEWDENGKPKGPAKEVYDYSEVVVIPYTEERWLASRKVEEALAKMTCGFQKIGGKGRKAVINFLRMAVDEDGPAILEKVTRSFKGKVDID